MKTFPKESFSRDSIIPSDHCYNLHNHGLSDDIERRCIIFMKIERGYYEYVGEHAKVNCEIIHTPKKGRSYPYGKWVNGIRILNEE